MSMRLKRARRAIASNVRWTVYGARREQEGARMASREACGVEAAGGRELCAHGGGGGRARWQREREDMGWDGTRWDGMGSQDRDQDQDVVRERKNVSRPQPGMTEL
jgi:hypothetical protein